MLRAAVYDGIPYYSVQEYYKTVYFFDANMNYLSSYKFENYPKAYANANGVHWFYAGSPVYSADCKEWEHASDAAMPCWNYGRVSAKTVNGKIYLSDNGVDFSRVKYQSFTGDYIDSVGKYYYCALGNVLWYSDNGVYWNKYVSEERIKRVDCSRGSIVINGSRSLSCEDAGCAIIKVNDEFLGFDKKPYISDGYTYAPLRFLCEALGAEVDWADGVITIEADGVKIRLAENNKVAYVNNKAEIIAAPAVNNDSTAYIPVRYVAERLGFKVGYDDGIVTVWKNPAAE